MNKLNIPPHGKIFWIKIDLACDKFIAEEFEKTFSRFFQRHHGALSQLPSKRTGCIRV